VPNFNRTHDAVVPIRANSKFWAERVLAARLLLACALCGTDRCGEKTRSRMNGWNQLPVSHSLNKQPEQPHGAPQKGILAARARGRFQVARCDALNNKRHRSIFPKPGISCIQHGAFRMHRLCGAAVRGS